MTEDVTEIKFEQLNRDVLDIKKQIEGLPEFDDGQFLEGRQPYGSDKHGLSLLAEQIKAMKNYEEILQERIKYERGKSN